MKTSEYIYESKEEYTGEYLSPIEVLMMYFVPKKDKMKGLTKGDIAEIYNNGIGFITEEDE